MTTSTTSTTETIGQLPVELTGDGKARTPHVYADQGNRYALMICTFIDQQTWASSKTYLLLPPCVQHEFVPVPKLGEAERWQCMQPYRVRWLLHTLGMPFPVTPAGEALIAGEG